MSANIPYQLRPNKHVDRQLFISCLSAILPNLGLEKYCYISMGGRHLVDHKVIYKSLGISALYSFDADAEIVRRQNFNSPIDTTLCIAHHSSELASKLDDILNYFTPKQNAVIWLDYTDPHARLGQLLEAVDVMKRMQPGDVLRITLNANEGSLVKSTAEWKEEGYESPSQFRAVKYVESIGDFAPIGLERIKDGELPKVLNKSLQIAISRARMENKSVDLCPVLITEYRDGQRMYTATLLALDPRKGNDQLRQKLTQMGVNIGSWDKLISVVAPDFSQKEKYRIDSILSKETQEIIDALEFLPEASAQKSEVAIKSYKELHRFYPTYHQVDL